jgi:hypothetical protein
MHAPQYAFCWCPDILHGTQHWRRFGCTCVDAGAAQVERQLRLKSSILEGGNYRPREGTDFSSVLQLVEGDQEWRLVTHHNDATEFRPKQRSGCHSIP